MVFFLQVDAPSVINEAVSNPESLSPKVLLIALLSYLVCAVIQYYVSVLLKRRDMRNDRQMKIADLTVEKEIELFKKLDHLRTFQKDENQQLLSELENIRELLGQNRLMYRKELSTIADEFTDYFSIVCTDYSKRDLKKELKLLDKYRNQFYS